MKNSLWVLGAVTILGFFGFLGSFAPNHDIDSLQTNPVATITLVPTDTPTQTPIATIKPTNTPIPTFTPTPTIYYPPTATPTTYYIPQQNTQSTSLQTQSSCVGATAECNDGTCSYSAHRSGTCSHHGGVAIWE